MSAESDNEAVEATESLAEDEELSSSASLDLNLEVATSTIPPNAPAPSSDAQKKALLRAWTKMAEASVSVVKTIKKNERLFKRLTWLVVVAVLVGTASDFYNSYCMRTDLRSHMEHAEKQRVEETAKLAKKQQATLEAVVALTEALGKKIEADAKSSIVADEVVEVAALDAQKAALEAKKEVTDSYKEKAEADRAIKEVEVKKAEKKNGL